MLCGTQPLVYLVYPLLTKVGGYARHKWELRTRGYVGGVRGCEIYVVCLSEIRARGGENTHCTREDSEALLEVQSLGIEEISPAFLSRDYQYRVLMT